MGYMEARGGKRTICFTPSEEFYAKNSVGLEGILPIPDIKSGNTAIAAKNIEPPIVILLNTVFKYSAV